jgi:hypothetical protein
VGFAPRVPMRNAHANPGLSVQPFQLMKPCDPILFRELPVIQKIIQDETWLEGERRGCAVHPSDRVVREKVCEIILRIGQQLRDSLSAACSSDDNGPRDPAGAARISAIESTGANRAA